MLDWDAVLGCAAGAAVGLWAVHSHAIESTESTDLYARAGAAVGLLAIALAVLALLTGFLSGRTAYILRGRKGGTYEFFRPFKLIARISESPLLEVSSVPLTLPQRTSQSMGRRP